MDTGSDPSVYNMRFSLSFFSILFITLVQQQTIPSYFDDKIIFDAERKPRIYSIFPFWFATWMVYLPQLLVNTITFGTLVYVMAGYRAGVSFYLFYILLLVLTALNGFAICQCVACVSPTPQTAMSVFPVIVFSLMSVAGYFVALGSLDPWIHGWAPNLSPLRWSLQGIILNEMEGNNDLPLETAYLEKYGYDTLDDKSKSFAYALLICIALFVALVYAVRAKKVVRPVL
jgi:MFS family permease